MLDSFPLSEVYLIYMTFRELVLFPSLGPFERFQFDPDRFYFLRKKCHKCHKVTTNHLKTRVEPTPETSCISNISQTMDNVKQSSYNILFLSAIYEKVKLNKVPHCYVLISKQRRGPD
jgi:hypothetical protein